jgi:hypothetical protein
MKSISFINIVVLLTVFHILSCNKKISTPEEEVHTFPNQNENPRKITDKKTIQIKKSESNWDHNNPERIAQLRNKLQAMDADSLVSIASTLDAKNSESDREYLYHLLDALGPKNPEAALHIIQELGPECRNVFMNGTMFERMIEKDPDMVITWIKNNGSRSDPANSISRLTMTAMLASAAPEQAVALYSAINSSNQVQCLFNVMATIARLQPDKAESLLSTLSDQNKHYATIAACRVIAKNNTNKAFEIANRSSTQTREKAFAEIWSSMIENSSSTIVQDIKSIPPDYFNTLLQQKGSIEKLSTIDPKLIPQILSNLPLTEANASVYQRAIESLALTDKNAAYDLLSVMPNTAVTGKFIEAMFSKMAQADLSQSTAEVAKLPKEQQAYAMAAIAKQHAKVSLDQAIHYIESNLANDKQKTYREISRTAALYNSANALKIIENSSMTDKIGADFRQDMINHTVQNWAKQDREAAQQWVEKLPAADQPKGVQGLVASWMKTDPIAASEWLSKQPAGPARDAGAREVIKQIKDTDPQMAKQWRDSLTPKE